MWSNEGQSGLLQALMTAGLIGLGVIAASTPSAAQPITGNQNSQFPSPQNDDVAEQEYPFWTLAKLPKQSFMREIYWQHPADTPAFFRDSLLQLVGRTYYFDKDNFNGTRSRAWTAGGWIAFRSGLIGNIFGVHVAAYTSQPLFAPEGEGGTRLLTQEQDPLNVIGQVYGRVQIFDQEIRGGRMLVDTPLINPQDSRMIPNTFEGVQLVSLPDKDRMYDYAAGYLWTIKPRDSNDFIPMSDALAGPDVVDRQVPFGMVKVRPLPGLTAIAMDYYLEDFINTSFGQVEYNFQPSKAASELHVRRQRHRSELRRCEPAGRTKLRNLPVLRQGADFLHGLDPVRRGLDHGRRAEHRLAVRRQAELYRHAADLVRQRRREGDRRQHRL